MNTTKQTFVKLAAICLLQLLLTGAKCNAQEKYSIKDRWNIKTNYCFYPNLGMKAPWESDRTNVFQAEANYGVLNFMEVGLYSGYAQVNSHSMYPINDKEAFFSEKSNTPVLLYGVNTNVHLFPFFVKSEKFRIDFYLSGKLGGYYIYSNKDADYTIPERGYNIDYGIYSGLSIYLGEHWGVNGEYGLGKYCNSRVGLTFKF